jgi:putative oxidoreductase
VRESLNRSPFVDSEPERISVAEVTEAFSWPLIRIATGLFFLPHGMQKLFGFWDGGLARAAAEFARSGLEPAMFWATYIGSLEFFGGLLIVGGFLTRPVAILLIGFMAVAAFYVHIEIGWFWSRGGAEVPLYLMAICIAILIRGGGPMSLDQLFGRQF